MTICQSHFRPRLFLLAATLLLLIQPVVGADIPLMNILEEDARILIRRGDNVILQYNKQPTGEAAKHESYYTRSGYIHPLYTPSGKEVTGDYAEDHKHQHGLFFAWTKTEHRGKELEFWNQKLEMGKVSFSRKLEKGSFSGREKCCLVVEHLWENIEDPGKPFPVLKETWKITAHDAGEDRYVFDIESAQSLVGAEPLTIKKYHYGGMAIRGNYQWLSPDKNAEPPAAMLTSEGLARIEGNHSRPRWVAMHGPLDGGHSGVAVLSDPRNFRAPQWVRLHPTKPYFVYAPMVEEPFQIKAGEPYVSRYRYVVFDGEADAGALDEEWQKLKKSVSDSK